MKHSTTNHWFLVVLLTLTTGACTDTRESGAPPINMVEILLTSESGHKLASMEVVPFQAGNTDGTVISVYPDSIKQTIDGIGTSFTESSAFVLAHLEPERRRDVMQKIYGENGANFTLTRTHIGSCDFTLKGKYSYADKPDDEDLTAFSIAPDVAGFDPADYPGIKDASYDLLPMIHEALEDWTDVILADPHSASHAYGVAVHWYASTFKVYEDAFDRVHSKFPDCTIIHTEGCIDNLGNDALAGIEDPIRFKESGWFNNDAFWWNANATDWAYSATWAGPSAADHPIYTPVHRYARNIIVCLDHWVSGWVDWNIVLDREGGPNHVGNFCGAPIMIDTSTREVYYTPIYYVLAQFSRTIRPGDRAVGLDRTLVGLNSDALHASATINDDALVSVQLLNTTKEAIDYSLQISDRYADVTIPANSVQTVRVQL